MGSRIDPLVYYNIILKILLLNDIELLTFLDHIIFEVTVEILMETARYV